MINIMMCNIKEGECAKKEDCLRFKIDPNHNSNKDAVGNLNWICNKHSNYKFFHEIKEGIPLKTSEEGEVVE